MLPPRATLTDQPYGAMNRSRSAGVLARGPPPWPYPADGAGHVVAVAKHTEAEVMLMSTSECQRALLRRQQDLERLEARLYEVSAQQQFESSQLKHELEQTVRYKEELRFATGVARQRYGEEQS